MDLFVRLSRSLPSSGPLNDSLNASEGAVNNTLVDNDEPPNPMEFIGVSEYIRIAVYILIFFICVVGNGLVIVTLLQNRKMRTVTNIFLINLSVADLLLGVFCMPVTLTGQLLKEFVFGAITCAVINYFQIVSVAVSTFTLVSISIERYFAICCPLTSRRWQTVSHSIKMTIVCWVLALILVSPVTIFTKYGKYMSIGDRDYYYCREKYPSEEFEIAYNSFLLCVLFGFPGIFMILAYAKITQTLWTGIRNETRAAHPDEMVTSPTESSTSNGLMLRRSGSKWARIRRGLWKSAASTVDSSQSNSTMAECETPGVAHANGKPMTPMGVRNTNSHKNLQAKKRTILMLITVVCEFFVSFTPIWLVNYIGLFVDRSTLEHIQPFVPYLQMLMYTSTCCNPITYCFLHSKFREGFIQAFTCGKRRGTTSFEMSRSTTAMSRASNPTRNFPKSHSALSAEALQMAPRNKAKWRTMDNEDRLL